MTDFFLDNFAGGGSLASHSPDVGGAYSSVAPLANFTLSGGRLIVPYAVIVSSYVQPATSVVTFPASWILEGSLTLSAPPNNPNGKLYFALQVDGPISAVARSEILCELGFIDITAYNSTGTGGSTSSYAPPNPITVGVPIVLRIERAANNLEFFADGVSLTSFAMPTPLNTPISVSIEVWEGNLMGTAGGTCDGGIDYVQGWSTVVPPFWQDYVKSVETA